MLTTIRLGVKFLTAKSTPPKLRYECLKYRPKGLPDSTLEVGDLPSKQYGVEVLQNLHYLTKDRLLVGPVIEEYLCIGTHDNAELFFLLEPGSNYLGQDLSNTTPHTPAIGVGELSPLLDKSTLLLPDERTGSRFGFGLQGLRCQGSHLAAFAQPE